MILGAKVVYRSLSAFRGLGPVVVTGIAPVSFQPSLLSTGIRHFSLQKRGLSDTWRNPYNPRKNTY